jgi:hypothetical protein
MYEIHGIVTADCPISFFMVDAGYTFGAAVGECGLLNSFASVDMELAWKYFYAGQNNELEVLIELGEFYMDLVECFKIIDREVMDSALDKTIERVADNSFNNTLYPPYNGLTEREFEIVNKGMREAVEKYRGMYGLDQK